MSHSCRERKHQLIFTIPPRRGFTDLCIHVSLFSFLLVSLLIKQTYNVLISQLYRCCNVDSDAFLIN